MTDVTDHVSPSRGASLLEARGMRLRELAEKADDQAGSPAPAPADAPDGAETSGAPALGRTLVPDEAETSPGRSGSGSPSRRVIAGAIVALVAVAGIAGIGVLRSSGATEPVTAAPASTAAAAPAVAPVDADAAFCAAARQVSMDDLAVLSQHVVDQPIQTEAAYRDLYTYAPAELRADLDAQRPIVDRVIAASHAGAITTTGAFTDLIKTAPVDETTAWVVAQGHLVPALEARC